MLLACTGVVFAQQDTKAPDDGQQEESTTPDSEQQTTTPEGEEETTSPDPRGQPAEQAADRYIVVLKDDAGRPSDVASEQAQEHGLQVKHSYQRVLKGYSAIIPERRVEAVRSDERVLSVEKDQPVQAFAQTLPRGVDRIDGDLSSTRAGNGSGAVNAGVAVIDTGIATHPDLNVASQGKNAITNKGVQPTNNCTDGTRTRTNFTDDNGHGTHVAGTIGAKDDGQGAVGVAPGARLYGVKVLDANGSGYRSDVICGIDWVTQSAPTLGIKVANMSLGGDGSDSNRLKADCTPVDPARPDAYHTAICNSVKAGITYAVAAGNENTDMKAKVPAAYDEVISVTNVADFDGKPGALYKSWRCTQDKDDTARDTSNFTTVTTTSGSGDAGHTIAAPGTCIYSTLPGGTYGNKSGTSMASPHIAGMAALCIAAGKCTGTPSDIMNKLRTDAQTKTKSTTSGTYYGFREDPHRVTSTGSRFYGYMGYAQGY